MKRSSPSRTDYKRIAEFIAMLCVALLLIGLSRLETRLFDLSKSLSAHHDFFTSVIYFGQINANVVLILILSWLIFRNVAKLVLDRRRGVIGSRLKMKLVISFIFFALAPTILMFYVSSRFITTSFDTWLSGQVRDMMQVTRQAGSKIYEQDQRRLESLARIALQRVNVSHGAMRFPGDYPLMEADGLEGFINEYRLNAVRLFDVNARLVWSSDGRHLRAAESEEVDQDSDEVNIDTVAIVKSPDFVRETIYRFLTESSLVSRGTVENVGDRDVVKGIAPVIDALSGSLVGVVLTEEQFEMRILRSIEGILDDFASLRPGAQLIRLSYLILLAVMVTLILFSATWLGFYVAKGITTPIQSLAEASREVSLGNYGVTLQARTDDETGQLIRAFNRMTRDLRRHKEAVEASKASLQMSNDELERRRKHMEVILKNVSAGVISVDANNIVTSVNNSAERLLGMQEEKMVGVAIQKALGDELWSQLWLPVEESLLDRRYFSEERELTMSGKRVTLILDGARIYDEQGEDLGAVLVFDDATEQVKAQKVAAWREVARRIAHEIKNPITPIMLNAQRLSRRYDGKFQGEDQVVFKACINNIIAQVNSLKNMVNEFSKFSQLPAIKPKHECINGLLTEIADMYQTSYPNVYIDASDLAQGLPNALIDREQMKRVFVNLVANALAAVEGKKNPKISIKTQADFGLNVVRISVEDNGGGIAPEHFDRVTEPYFSTKKDGTGLGLAIVNQIVAEHSGYLRFAPRPEGGTTVIVELPMAQKVS